MAIMLDRLGRRVPVVTALSRPLPHDLSIDALQKARESGIAIAQQNQAARAEGIGLSADPIQALLDATTSHGEKAISGIR